MRIPDSLAAELTMSAGLINEDQIDELYDISENVKLPLQDLIISNGFISEKHLTKLFAENIGLPFYDLKPRLIKHEDLLRLPANVAIRYRAVVIGKDQEKTKLAVSTLLHQGDLDFLGRLLGEFDLYIASDSALDDVLDRYYLHSNNVIKLATNVEHRKSLAGLSEADKNAGLNKTIEALIKHAVNADADAIHIEPQENYLSVRLRIDGVLKEEFKLPLSITSDLNKQLDKYFEAKAVAHGEGKEGYVTVKMEALKYELKFYSINTYGGIKNLISIIRPFSFQTLEDLGLVGTNLKLVNLSLARENGLILISGPNNSGKTSLIYAVAKMLARSDVHSVSLEQTIKHHLSKVSQYELRSINDDMFNHILAEQPQAVLIDQIEHSSTAEFAIKSSIGGRLAVAAISAPSAVHAPLRLISMGVSPHSVSSTLKTSINSLLARRLCESCKIEFKPSSTYLEKVEHHFKLDKFGGISSLMTLARTSYGYKDSGSINKLYRANEDGCDNCRQGYKGLIGLYEVLENNESISIDLSSSAVVKELYSKALTNGLVPLELDGLIKTLLGITSIDEIARVVRQRPTNFY